VRAREPRSGNARSVVLLGVAVALAAQVPSTIQTIPDATVRAMVMVFTLIAVVACSILVDTRQVKTAIVNSLRPPARQDEPGERISIRPPALLPFDMDEDDRTPTTPPTPAPDTPRETPAGRRRKRS
jgi:hypothetical protein